MAFIRKLVLCAVASFAATSFATADSLLVGFNTQTPLQVYSTTGTYQQDFGPAGASAGIEENGLLYVVQPSMSATTSTISALNAAQQVVGSFSVPALIADGAPGQGGTLWLAGYNGTVYQVSTSGTVLSSFDTGYGTGTSIGIATNGSTLYTSEGDGNDGIDVRSSSGVIQSTIHTGLNNLYGLAYNSANSSLYAATFNNVYDLSLTGSLLSTLNVAGDSRTPNGAIHDGLELVDLSTLQSSSPPPPPPPTVPEPSLGWMTGLIVAAFIGFKTLRGRIPARFLAAGVAALGLGTASLAAVNVTLTTAVPSGASVGTTIWVYYHATDTTNPNATFTYQFSVGASGQPLQVKRDFYPYESFMWVPSDADGLYDLQVIAHSSTGATGMTTETYELTPRAVSGPVVSHTNHPLVALYSMPPCPSGRTARVRFKLPSDAIWQTTSTKTCNGQTSLNFYVAGMRASTTYELQHDLFNGPFDTPGPILNFTTGAIPAGMVTSPTTVKPFVAPTNTAYPVLLNSAIGTAPYATDTSGNIIWYLPVPDVLVEYFDHPVDGGTFLVQTTNSSAPGPSKLLREYDLAGNVVRETNTDAISAQLVAKGADPVTTTHHEAIRLANGGTAILASVEKVANQGAGNVDVVGDQVVILDSNFQVSWWWNEFHHFPITRPAVLGETCAAGQAGCAAPENPAYRVANDWTHSNSVWEGPDGNLLVSSRHQDWIVKIPYQNGQAPPDGNTIWTMGVDGSFRALSSDPYPWFSHQHNAEIQANGMMTVFDDGNTRIQENNGVGHSRGQAWIINETNFTAIPAVNIDLGQFSLATGSAELLSNGNYTFDLGVLNNGTTSSTQEYTASGGLQSEVNLSKISYRSWRMRSLYQQR